MDEEFEEKVKEMREQGLLGVDNDNTTGLIAIATALAILAIGLLVLLK